MNEPTLLVPPSVSSMDTSSSSLSPVEQKPATSLWRNSTQFNLSPPAGDQAAVSGVNSEPMQSSSAREPDDACFSELDKNGDGDISGDPEGVWSPDIEQAFQEALAIYPPCGRRKIILSDEGKMYGRNELIARYIKIRCGKTRTRKQVSSHIQVLARKKQRESNGGKPIKSESVSPPSMASATASATTTPPKPAPAPLIPIDMKPSIAPPAATAPSNPPAQAVPRIDVKQPDLPSIDFSTLFPGPLPNLFSLNPLHLPAFPNNSYLNAAVGMDQLYGLSIPALRPTAVHPQPPPKKKMMMNEKLALKDFAAFIENGDSRKRFMSISTTDEVPEGSDDSAKPHSLSSEEFKDTFPPKFGELTEKLRASFVVKCWPNIDFDDEVASSSFTYDMTYVSTERFPLLRVHTYACSFDEISIEKREEMLPAEKSGVFEYKVERSEACDFIKTLIIELLKLPSKEEMNEVVGNFTVIQEVNAVREDSSDPELLFVFAILFAIEDHNDGSDFVKVVP